MLAYDTPTVEEMDDVINPVQPTDVTLQGHEQFLLATGKSMAVVGSLLEHLDGCPQSQSRDDIREAVIHLLQHMALTANRGAYKRMDAQERLLIVNAVAENVRCEANAIAGARE